MKFLNHHVALEKVDQAYFQPPNRKVPRSTLSDGEIYELCLNFVGKCYFGDRPIPMQES